jgi:hypothetical protein
MDRANSRRQISPTEWELARRIKQSIAKMRLYERLKPSISVPDGKHTHQAIGPSSTRIETAGKGYRENYGLTRPGDFSSGHQGLAHELRSLSPNSLRRSVAHRTLPLLLRPNSLRRLQHLDHAAPSPQTQR